MKPQRFTDRQKTFSIPELSCALLVRTTMERSKIWSWQPHSRDPVKFYHSALANLLAGNEQVALKSWDRAMKLGITRRANCPFRSNQISNESRAKSRDCGPRTPSSSDSGSGARFLVQEYSIYRLSFRYKFLFTPKIVPNMVEQTKPLLKCRK